MTTAARGMAGAIGDCELGDAGEAGIGSQYPGRRKERGAADLAADRHGILYSWRSSGPRAGKLAING